MKHIYLDHAATTYVKPEVLDKMLPYFTDNFGNPSSIYYYGRENKKAVEDAREKVAKILGAKSNEIYFTASGSEADNWAVRGAAYANIKKGKHIITSNIEHHAMLNLFKELEKEGFEVTYVEVEENGIIDPEKVKNAIRPDTTLISIMFANNEIGTIQPIKEIGKTAKEHNVIFCVDAVQAAGHIDIDVNELNVDLLSISAHKFYGPKGVGALYIRKGTKVKNFVFGGNQESGKRAGTENVPGIIGLAEALELAVNNMEEENKKLIELRNMTIALIKEKIPYVRLNGDEKNRLAGNVNFSFRYIEGESLLLMLDIKGFACSSGSACTSGSLDPSHVLLAIGLPHEIAHGSLRITFGSCNTMEDVHKLVDALVEIVAKLRAMSPLYEEVEKQLTNK